MANSEKLRFLKETKILIIDDKFYEIEPLMRIFNGLGVSTIFNDGIICENFSKINGVRIIITDLNVFSDDYNANTISNTVSHIKNLICDNNGPYALIVWSSAKENKEMVRKNILEEFGEKKPEEIQFLDKNHYFKLKSLDSSNEVTKQLMKLSDKEHIFLINQFLEEYDELSDDDEYSAIYELLKLISENRNINLNEILSFDESRFDKLKATLIDLMEKMNLLYMFMIWEYNVKNLAPELVNELYNIVSSIEGIDSNERLKLLFSYIVSSHIGKTVDSKSPNEKNKAFFEELQDLLLYYIDSGFSNMGGTNTDYYNKKILDKYPCFPYYDLNRMKMLRCVYNNREAGCLYKKDSSIENSGKTLIELLSLENYCRGKIYDILKSYLSNIKDEIYKKDAEEFINSFINEIKWSSIGKNDEINKIKEFEKKDIFKKLKSKEEKIMKVITDISSFNNAEKNIYLININGQCEVAQGKNPVTKVTTAYMIEKCGFLTSLISDKNSLGDYIFREFPMFKYKEKIYYLIVDMSKCTYIENEDADKRECSLKIRDIYYTKLRNSISDYYGKQGLDLYIK